MVNLIRVRRVGNQVYREGRRSPDFHVATIDMVQRGDFRWMAAVRSNKIISSPLLEAILRNRTVGNEMIQLVDALFQKLDDRQTT
jgi:hypothetical protein